MSLRLCKREKLCSVTAVGRLFAIRQRGVSSLQGSLIAYPLRMVWRVNPERTTTTGVQFLISVPKKKLRHAVDRVAMRRRIREAYRLNRQLIPLPDDKPSVDVAFIYVADRLIDSAHVHAAMTKMLQKVAAELLKNQSDDTTNA